MERWRKGREMVDAATLGAGGSQQQSRPFHYPIQLHLSTACTDPLQEVQHRGLAAFDSNELKHISRAR